MSVPIAVAGLKPKMNTRIGVMSEPPPMPVMPTRTPMARPARTNCQVTAAPAERPVLGTPTGVSRNPPRRSKRREPSVTGSCGYEVPAWSQELAFLESSDDAVGRLLDPERRHIEMHVGTLGRLVRPARAGEVPQAALTGLRVQAFRVALRGELERDVDEHLDELALAEEGACRRTVGAERRHECREHDEPRVGHELRHLGRTPVVLRAVGVAEA